MAELVNYSIIQNLATLKEALEISGDADDSRLKGYLNRATDMIEKWCDRRFLSTAYTDEEYSGDGSHWLKVRNWPVTALTSLQVNNGTFDSANWDSIDASHYKLVSEGGNTNGLIYNQEGFRRGVNNYRVSYTAGYAANAIPHDLQEVAIEIVAYLNGKRKMTPGMRSETLGRYSYSTEPTTGQGIIAYLGLDAILDMYHDITV